MEALIRSHGPFRVPAEASFTTQATAERSYSDDELPLARPCSDISILGFAPIATFLTLYLRIALKMSKKHVN